MNKEKKFKIFTVLSRNYILKAFSSFFLTQLIGAVIGFALLVLYTKFLPPEDYGKITLIWIFVSILSMTIDSGLNTAFSIKFYKVSKEENTKHLYSILIYNVIIFSIFYLVFLLVPSLFLRLSRVQLSSLNLTIVFLLILFTILGRFYTNILMISKKPKDYFYVNLLFYIILAISSIIFLLVLKMGYISYIKAYLTAYFVLSIVGLKFLLMYYKPCKKDIFSLIRIKKLLKLGLPLVPNSMLLMLLTYADRYLLDKYVGLAIVGIYSVGYTFAEKINTLIINPFGQAFSPLAFELFAKSLNEYKEMLQKVLKNYCLLIGGVIIAYFVILKEVFHLLIGVKYIEGYNIIAIVLFGIIFSGAANLLSGTIIMKEKTDKMFLFTTISVLLNILLNFLLIPQYGMYGAALATFLSYVIHFVIIFAYTQKLVFISYDYKFIFKSSLIVLLFFTIVLYLSYLKINVCTALLLKAIVLLGFVFLLHKLNFKKSLKEMLKYGILPQ